MIRAALSLLLVLFLGACASDPTKGYSLGWSFDDSIETVSVPMFENRTYVTGIEATLTDAIIKRIQSRTPWAVTQRNADTTLVGEITNVRRRILSNSPESGFVQDQAVTIEITYTWRDNRTGETLSQASRFAASTAVIPVRGSDGSIGERPEIGQRDVIAELAEAVVDNMRSRW
ncbi:MAG: LPS assembly lipoprotein LptE [Planctomycetota bacterium]